MLQWLWFESTGGVWSPSMRAMGLAPTLRWACTGRDADARREGYSPGEAFRAGMREAELEALRFELAETRGELERLRAAPGQPSAGDQRAAGPRWSDIIGAADRPPLAAGQRWRSGSGRTLETRAGIFGMVEAFDSAGVIALPGSVAAPDGWTFAGYVEPAPAMRIERREDVESPAKPPAEDTPVVRWSAASAHLVRVCTCPGVAAPQERDAVDGCPTCTLWRVVKPRAVAPGQVWRCVGVEGELVVETVIDGEPGDLQSVRLAAEGGVPRVWANQASMLGLGQWSFVRAGGAS